jgi:hypothetical protein
LIFLFKYFRTKKTRDLRLAIIIGLFGPLLSYCCALLLSKWMAHAFRDI